MRTDASEPSQPLLPLHIDNISFEAGGQRLLDDITLRLSGQGLTALMGYNGAGKSLLLRMMHGLITPQRGRISWNGLPATDYRVRLQQSTVFQKPVLLNRSVAANIDYVLRLRKRADVTLRNRILDDAGLSHRARQPALSLSGGEQQRLCLARALATQPQVLFLDEPCANLDPGSTGRIEQVLLQVRRSTKVFMVTHDIAQARRLAEDIVFLDRGRLCEHSNPAQFFDKPASTPARHYLNGILQSH